MSRRMAASATSRSFNTGDPAAATKRLVLIHGRWFKPDEATLKEHWIRALEHGLKRDYGDLSDEVARFKDVKIDFVYYGDLTHDWFQTYDKPHAKAYDVGKDVREREKDLQRQQEYKTEDFLEDNGRRNFQSIPGWRWPSWAATAAWFLGDFFRLERLAGLKVPFGPSFRDMEAYWKGTLNGGARFGSDLRARLTEPLQAAVEKGDDIMLIAHSLGTMISYDVLWKFSHYYEYRKLRENGRAPMINTFLTLGTPLGNKTVKEHLKSAGETGRFRFPTNIQKWHNVAAEGDFVAHDSKIVDDYKEMITLGLIEPHNFTDELIYNLSERGGAADPHHSAGYLIHPTVTKHVANWLMGR